MTVETPQPREGDRVRVTPKPYEGELKCDGTQGRLIQVRDDEGRLNAFGPDYATIEVLARALCPATEGATGIRCQQPRGHEGGHKGTSTDEQTAVVGYPLFVSWPAEAESPARREVRVENTPDGLSIPDRQKVADLLVAGKPAEAVAAAHNAGLDYPDADAYVRQMPEYETYLNHHGRTEVDPTEADRMRAMGFDKQPELKISDEDKELIRSVLLDRQGEYFDGNLYTEPLAGVVADIVYAAIVQDRKRGDR